MPRLRRLDGFADTAVAAETAVAIQAAVVPEAALAAEAAIVRDGGLARERRGRDRRSPIAVVTLVVVAVAVSVLALNTTSPFRADGQVASATGTPAGVMGAPSSSRQSPLP